MANLLTCAICDAREPEPVLPKLGLTIVRCRRCGLLYVDPRLSTDDLWTRYSPRYFHEEYLPSLGVVEGRFDLGTFDRRYRPHLDLLGQPHGKRSRLLEVGAGAGFFLKAAERKGWEVIGVEVSDEAVHFARETLNLDVRHQAAETIDFPNGFFQAAVMLETIEHLLDPLRTLMELRRVLQPGAPLLISTPNYDALSRFALGRQWAVLSPLEHIYYFTEGTLTALLQRAGFTDLLFHRQFSGWGVLETMNPHYTHAPQGTRAKLYLLLVRRFGHLVYRPVQAFGRGDTLLCVARAYPREVANEAPCV